MNFQQTSYNLPTNFLRTSYKDLKSSYVKDLKVEESYDIFEKDCIMMLVIFTALNYSNCSQNCIHKTYCNNVIIIFETGGSSLQKANLIIVPNFKSDRKKFVN